VHLLECGWERWLDGFADELIANKSFAEVLRRSPLKVKESLDALPSFTRVPKAVQLPGRYPNYPGSQIVDLQIFWRRYTDKEIGEEMERLAGKLRPDSEKGPQRRGKGKASSVVALLDGLSAMRLASHYPKSLPSSCVRTDRLKNRRGTVTAIDIFDDIRLGKIDGVLVHSDLEEYTGRARRQFARWFPFGDAQNSVTWAQRQRRKQ
jgi:hypothetical protein